MSIRIISQNYTQDISFLTKNLPSFDVVLLLLPGVDCLPFSWTFIGNPGDGGESYPIAKNFLVSAIRKFPLIDFYLRLSKMSFTPYQIAIFMSSSYASFICSCCHFYYNIFFFNFTLYLHTCHAHFDKSTFTECSL